MSELKTIVRFFDAHKCAAGWNSKIVASEFICDYDVMRYSDTQNLPLSNLHCRLLEKLANHKEIKGKLKVSPFSVFLLFSLCFASFLKQNAPKYMKYCPKCAEPLLRAKVTCNSTNSFEKSIFHQFVQMF